MPAEPKEPRTAAGKDEYRLEATEAGRALSNLAHALWWQPNPLAGANAMQSATAEVRKAIAAIEEQAATEARRELLAKVEGLRPVPGDRDGNLLWRAEVLRLIEESDRD